jgi:proline iminopeptidase
VFVVAIEEHVPTRDGAHLWTSREGSGLPLVLCHGGPGLWDYLGDLAATLSNDFTVYRWDQRACGRSTAGSVPASTSGTLDDLEALRSHFGHEQWSVLGHSFGAELALLYALLFPDSCRCVAYVSGRGSARWWQTTGRAANRANVERRMTSQQFERLSTLSGLDTRSQDEEIEFRRLSWMSDFVDPESSDALDTMARTPFAINLAVNRALATDPVFDDDALRSACAACRVPMLFIHGTQDPRPLEGAAQLSELIPTATMTVIPGAGHLPWIERPEIFKGLLTPFINRAARP